jgi:hypothetical protein
MFRVWFQFPRLRLWFWDSCEGWSCWSITREQSNIDNNDISEKYWLNKYEDVVKKSEKKVEEKENKINMITELDAVIEKLTWYKKRFEKEKNTEMVTSVENDIKKYQTQKQELEKEVG